MISRRTLLGLTALCPPAGLVLLWRRSGPVWRKLAGSLAILVYGPVWLAALGFLAFRFTPLQLEWEGGFPPVPTFRKTVPDYDAVERDRARQAEAVPARPAAPVRVFTNYWTGFRGPARDGHYTEMPIRTNWPAGGLKPLWRQPVGGGYASFSIADGRAYTIEQRRDQEAITAYDIDTGRELWARSYPARFDESMGGEGPRSTPTWDQGRLFALGGTGEFHCLDAATGAVLWRTNILTAFGGENLFWAQSASPFVLGDQVILVPGGSNGRSIVSCNVTNGAVRWSVRNEPAAYSSPVLVTLAGRPQLLVAVLDRMLGLDAEDGATLWEFPWSIQQNNRNIAQPVLLGPDRLLLSAGYGTGSVALEVAGKEKGFEARELWRNKLLKNKFSSSVFWQGHIYGLDEDILTCLDAATGARKWKDGRYGYGQLILASGHLVILCGNGDLALVRATPDRHEEIARFPAIPGKTWNHPAIAGGRLLVRNAVEMACYDLSPTR